MFVLPLCLFFAFCSSSKKAVAPAGPGISNVNVKRGDSMTSATKAAASFTSADRDWAYKSSRDTTLNGTWTLDGMLGANGSWTSASSSSATSSMTDTSMATMTSGTDASMSSANTTGGSNRTKGKSKNNRKALYDSAQARLRMNYKDTTSLDTTVQSFQYWKRVPSLTLNAGKQVFTGTTGCNSMSGSFHFSESNIQFGRNIATSKMACNEYDETAFLAALKKADSYTLNGNTLELKQAGTTLLTFKKS